VAITKDTDSIVLFILNFCFPTIEIVDISLYIQYTETTVRSGKR